jgi:hypothetical protein
MSTELIFGPHIRNCDCERCQNTPGSVAHYIKQIREDAKRLSDRIRESERITAEDLAIIVY